MKTFLDKKRKSMNLAHRASPYVHQPLGTRQYAQQENIHRILRVNDAQAKFTIGQPNDKYEQDADRVADQVMAIPEPKLKRQPENEEEEESLQAKSIINKPTIASNGIQRKIQSLKGRGQPLSKTERAFFEPRIGMNFRHVRIHNNSIAAYVARLINARAFTLGNDIVFARGAFTHGTDSGRRLLAHELTHVVQQSQLLNSTHQQRIQRQIALPPTTRGSHQVGVSRTVSTTTLDTFVRLAGYYYGDARVGSRKYPGLWYRLAAANRLNLKRQLNVRRAAGTLRGSVYRKLYRLLNFYNERIPLRFQIILPPFTKLLPAWKRRAYARTQGKAQARRWGQDTVGTFMSLRINANCFTRWPYHLEQHARTDLGIHGAASCNAKYAGRIAQVWDRRRGASRQQPIEVVCADTSGKGDDYIELSPAAARDLAGTKFQDFHPIRIKHKTEFDTNLVYISHDDTRYPHYLQKTKKIRGRTVKLRKPIPRNLCDLTRRKNRGMWDCIMYACRRNRYRRNIYNRNLWWPVV